jgi:histidinol dehydrogenase
MIQIQKVTKAEFQKVYKPAMIIAENEGLFAHGQALKIRK